MSIIIQRLVNNMKLTKRQIQEYNNDIVKSAEDLYYLGSNNQKSRGRDSDFVLILSNLLDILLSSFFLRGFLTELQIPDQDHP